MNKYTLFFMGGVLFFLISIVLILFHREHTRKTLDTIDKMLDQAIDNTFTESSFDESRLSALETKFAHYLSASAISSRNISAEREKIKTLIADISHQTKTPLSNLLLYSELLKEEPLPDSARSSAEALYLQAEKLRFLISSLVKMSRLETGIITLAPEAHPVFPMLEELVREYAPKAEKKGLSLCLKPTEALAEYDQKWTTEAIGNIIDNGIKYTDHGGITISVIPYELFVRIDIADTGMGISEEDSARIFSRFYRSEAVRDREGVGIGLFLAREIISGEGGYIKVFPNRNNGSVFSVYIPGILSKL